MMMNYSPENKVMVILNLNIFHFHSITYKTNVLITEIVNDENIIKSKCLVV